MIGQGRVSSAHSVSCTDLRPSRDASHGSLRISQNSVVAYGKSSDQFVHILPHKSLADRDLRDERNDP